MDNKIASFAERLAKHQTEGKAIIDEAKAADLDPAALRRLVAWKNKGPKGVMARQEREAVDHQYRHRDGLEPEPAVIPPDSELAKAAELLAQGKTRREAAQALKVSTGKAQKLMTWAEAFSVHPSVNVNTPAAVSHDVRKLSKRAK